MRYFCPRADLVRALHGWPRTAQWEFWLAPAPLRWWHSGVRLCCSNTDRAPAAANVLLHWQHVGVAAVKPHINFSLHSSYKEDTPPEIFLNKFYELCDEYKGFCRLYTDGSLMENRVACAVVSRTSCESVPLPNNTSIFRAELHAIMLAMRLIRKRKEKNYFFWLHVKSSSLDWIQTRARSHSKDLKRLLASYCHW